jgi:hypothetical protein
MKLRRVIESTYDGLEDADAFEEEADWLYVLRELDAAIKPNVVFVPDRGRGGRSVILFGEDETLKFIHSISPNSQHTTLSNLMDDLAIQDHGEVDFMVIDATSAGDHIDIQDSIRHYKANWDLR